MFDVEGARKAGYSDAEIAGFLASENKFDAKAAKNAGYTDAEVISYLVGQQAAAEPASRIPGTVRPPEPVKEPSIGERIIGAGEAALTVATGATGGAIGGVGGALGGLAASILSGQFGTPEAVKMVEQAATEGAGKLTYQPRTEQGQQQAQAVGEVAQNLVPLAGMAPQLSAVSALAGPAAAGIAPTARFALEKGRAAVQPAMERLRPAAAPSTAPSLAPLLPAPELAQVAKKAADGGIGSSKALKTLAEQTNPNPATVAAAKRLGIQDHLQPDHVTTNQAYRELAQAVKSIPGSEARAAELAGYEAIGARASALIDEIGGNSDVSQVSASLKNRMATTREALEKQADDLYAKVRKTIPAKSESPANEVLQFISQRADELGGAANLSPMEKRIVTRLTPKTTDGAVTNPTYALLDDVRRDVGAAARMAGPFKDADTGLAKKLYQLITDDQERAAEALGAGKIYNAAKASVRARKALEDDMAALFGKELDKSIIGDLSGAVRALPQGDSAKLIKLLRSVPDDMRQEVVASGLQLAFRSAATRGPINFTTYAKFYEGLLRNKQAYAAVMSTLPQASRKQLSDLYRVSDGISKASRERITTGRIQAVADEFKGADSLAAQIYEGVKRNAISAGVGTVAGGVMGPGVGAAIASALSRGPKGSSLKAADALLASNEFASLAKQGPTPKAVKALANSPAFHKYVRARGNPVEMKNREQWIEQAFRASPVLAIEHNRKP